MRNRLQSLVRRCSRARSLSRADWLVLVQASLLLAAVQVGLWLVGYGRVARFLERFAHLREPRRDNRMPPERLAWLVGVAARYHLLRPACLPQALVAHLMYARSGIHTELIVGARKSEKGLEAHAWLEQGGEAVFGRPGEHLPLYPGNPAAGRAANGGLRA